MEQNCSLHRQRERLLPRGKSYQVLSPLKLRAGERGVVPALQAQAGQGVRGGRGLAAVTMGVASTGSAHRRPDSGPPRCPLAGYVGRMPLCPQLNNGNQ